jgi:hypothetical protein
LAVLSHIFFLIAAHPGHRQLPGKNPIALATNKFIKKLSQRSFMQKPRWGLSGAEWRLLHSLNTPQKIQAFLDKKIRYNEEQHGETCRSPRVVLRSRRAHCIEGAMLAAAALRVNGHKPLIIDLAAKQDYDHVICVFKQEGHWGAISQSRYFTLQWRDPVFRTLRELCLSYFSFYNNLRGQKTLVSYSSPLNLKRFDGQNWMISEENLWDIGNYLFTIKHYNLYPKKLRPHLRSLSMQFVQADTMRRR